MLPFGSALAGDATKDRASASPKPRTLLTVRGQIEGFAQDGDAIVWANRDEPCARHILFRRLSTGKTRSLVSRKAPACNREESGGIQHRMALAGTRALWAYVEASNSSFHFDLHTASAGGVRQSKLGWIHTEGGLEDSSSFRPVPMAGDGPTLALADISTTESRNPTGVYRVTPALSRLSGTSGADTVAVAGRRLAFTRYIGPGCICNYSPQLSPDGRTIVFGSGRAEQPPFPGYAELYAMNTDGSGLRRLLRDVGGASFSPNGRSLLYVRTRILPLLYDRPEIYVASSDGTGSRRLARGASPSWSPDGSSVAYASSGFPYVFVVRSRGGKPTRIAQGDQPAWSPDGTKISVERDDGLYVVNVATRSARRIVHQPGEYVLDQQWSPDGTRIAFVVSAGLGYELQSVLSDGTARARLGTAVGAGIAWSPDSSTIAFSRPSGNERTVIALVSVAGGTPRDLTPGISPVWTRDGRGFVYVAPGDAQEEGGFGAEIARIAADGSSGQILTRTEPARGRNAVEVRDARTGKIAATFNTAVPGDRATAPSAVALSGSRIALVFYKTRTSRRLEIRTLGGSLTRTIAVPRPAADEIFMSGRWLVFRTGAVIRSVDVRSGRQSVLTRARGHVVGLSIDGRRVAWAEQGARTSRIRALVLPQ